MRHIIMQRTIVKWIGKSIRNELLLISGIGTALLVAASLFGFWLSWNSLGTFSNEVESRRADERMVRLMQLDFKKQVQEWKDVLLRGSDPESLEKYWGKFEEQEHKVQESAQTLKTRIGNQPKVLEFVDKFLSAHVEMGTAYRKGLQAFKDGNFDSKIGDAAVKGIDREPTELLTQAADAISKDAEQSANQAAESGRNGIFISLALMGAAVLVQFIFFLWMTQKTIVNPAASVVQDLHRLAQGDFSVPVQHVSNDELGKIAASTEEIRINLGRIVAEVNHAASELARAANGLSGTAADVASGSQQQTEAAASVAAAVEEITVSIASVADNALEVRQLSSASLERTQHADSNLAELVGQISSAETAVGEIEVSVAQFVRSAESITNMTQQVKEIADQTNLLALNAAIEAARAGEQGRGFAVVADEVRKLAEKSAQSASEIDSLTQTLSLQSAIVEKSIQKGRGSLRAGNEVLATVTTMLAEANLSVSDSNRGVGNITDSVQEQKVASNDIAKNVEKIALMAEENGIRIGATARETHHLSQLSVSLQDTMKHFKV